MFQIEKGIAFFIKEALKVMQNHKDEQKNKFLKTQFPIELGDLE